MGVWVDEQAKHVPPISGGRKSVTVYIREIGKRGSYVGHYGPKTGARLVRAVGISLALPTIDTALYFSIFSAPFWDNGTSCYVSFQDGESGRTLGKLIDEG